MAYIRFRKSKLHKGCNGRNEKKKEQKLSFINATNIPVVYHNTHIYSAHSPLDSE